jgi:MFS family permease
MKTAATADNDTSMNSETEIYLSTVGLDQLYKDPQAWLIALCFTLTTATGMYIAGTYKTFGQKFINNETFLTSVGAASSLFNMVGRLLWGIIGDRYGAMNGQLLLSFFFSFLLGLYFITENFDPMFYAVWTCLIFLFESGNFTLYLSMIIYLFGAKHAATNYGAIFFVYSMLNVCNISVLSYLNLEFPRICMVLGCTTFCGFIGVLILKRRTYGYTIRFDKK